MRNLTNEHEPRALMHSSPHYLRGLIFLILVSLGGGSFWYWQAQVPRVGGDRPLDQIGNFGVVPEFTLIERSERCITRNDLLGRVWVVHFFYASCLDTCPLQSAEMASLQRDLANAPDVRLVSISVDPDHDTPERLRAYAQRFGADPERWLFLTGAKAAIVRLAQDGFHLSVVEPGAAQSQKSPPLSRHRQARYWTSPSVLLSGLREMVSPTAALAHGGIAHQPMLHSSRFVLVDRQARLRGYYHSDEKASVRRLRRDVRTVLREPSVKG